jgi:hypothetical protein
MARANAKVNEEMSAASEPVTETITYVPGEGDPSTIKWCGIVFQANVGKEITGHAEGSERERLHHHLIESARTNKFFLVGNARVKRDAMGPPKTAEQYRATMIEWLKDPALDHADKLIARFARDRELQAACEVGADDFSYLSTLFMPRLHELAKADELTEGQVASLWLNHGINQLPW